MPKLVLGLCLDVSITLGGVGAHELHQGLGQLFDRVANHPGLASSVELTVVTFDHRGARVARKLAPVVVPDRPPPIDIPAPQGGEGLPDLLAAVNQLIDQISSDSDPESRFILVLLSNNVIPPGDREQLDKKACRLREFQDSRGTERCRCMPIRVGEPMDPDDMTPVPDLAALLDLSHEKYYVRMRGLMFRECFVWLADKLLDVLDGDTRLKESSSLPRWGEVRAEVMTGMPVGSREVIR